MHRLYLVDGFALVFRAYYALISHPLINSKQENTGAVYNFFRMLLRVLRDQKPEELVVVFDARGKNFRHEMYPEYKANRLKAPEDLLYQIPWIQELVTLFGIPSILQEGYEADDLIAAFVRHARKEGREVRIFSGDKDLMQLVDEGVHMLVPARDPTALLDEFGPPEVREKFGVPPEAIPDYLALVGDSSDNVPGVPGIGDKGARALIENWKSLDGIYKNIMSVTPEGTRKKLIAGEESARLSYRLVLLDRDLPRPLPPEGCRLPALNIDAALPRLRELELNTLIGELFRTAGRDAKTASISKTEMPLEAGHGRGGMDQSPEGRGQAKAGGGAKRGTAAKAASAPGGAADQGASLPLELFPAGENQEAREAARPAGAVPARGLELFAEGELQGAAASPEMSFGSAGHGWLAPADADGLMTSADSGCRWTLADSHEKLLDMIVKLREARLFAFDSETTALAFHSADLLGLSFSCREREAWYVPIGHTEASLPEELVLNELRPLFEDPSVGKIGQNTKFDCAILALRGIEAAGLEFDTMLAAYLLEPGSRVNLDDLAARYLKRRTIRYEEIVPDKKKTLADAPLADVLAYAAEDAEVCFSLAKALRPLLAAENLENVLRTIELPLVPVLVSMELAGIAVDGKRLADGSARMGERLRRLEEEIYAESGERFNLNSPKQLAAILFDRLGIPPVKKTKTGFSTDEEVLDALKQKHAIARLLLEYRKAYKLKSTYLDVLPTLAHPKTGRIHSSFNQAVTATGRLSSSEPNLQNIPIREEEGREVRTAFVPAPGCVFIGADYSQIELRILAALSGDPALAAAYTSGEDIHRRTAAQIFGISEEAVDRDRRAIAKTINFGVLYGQSAFGLAQELGISQKEARSFIDAWFEVYADVRGFTEAVIAKAEKDLLVHTWFGRLRRVPELREANHGRRQFGERMALNTVIQGTAADLIKLAMIGVSARFRAEGMRARLLLQVHDELLVEAPEDEAKKAGAILVEEMRRPWPFAIPLEIESGSGANWDEAH